MYGLWLEPRSWDRCRESCIWNFPGQGYPDVYKRQEQSFTDIGQELDMTPDQARAAYFYALRKLRKELGVKKDGI